MFFENTQRKIISQVFNADPKLIPTITRIYQSDAEFSSNDFKDYSTILIFFGLIAVGHYHYSDFNNWPILNSILAVVTTLQIFGSMMFLGFILFEFIKGNIRLRIFNKIIESYNANLNQTGGDNYERQ